MTTIQLRRATAAVARANNVTLAQGEVGVETDTGKFKIGDGSTAWNDLAYATDLSRLPASVVSTDDSDVGQVPVADGAGGYNWTALPAAADNSGFVGSTVSDTAIIQNANQTYGDRSGVVIMTACQVRGNATRLMYEVDYAGSGLTSGQNLLGVYDAHGNLVMDVGDQTDAYESPGGDYVPIVVSLPSTLPAGFYFVAQLMNYPSGATVPYLTGWKAPMVTEIGTKVMSPPRVCYSSGDAYTSLPSSVDWEADGFNGNTWEWVTFFAFLP